MFDIARNAARPTLLLIDDCVAERDLYQLTLQREFNILTASRGSDGVDIAIRERPDLVLCDVKMPGIDGWETCTRIKTHMETMDIPVVLLTASDDCDLTQHAMAVGATALLNKPCSAQKLTNMIHEALAM